MPEPVSYSDRFKNQQTVAEYESSEYGADSYSSQVWRWQRPVVTRIVEDAGKNRPKPVRLLDFACGTGRVLADIENLVDEATGVDISEGMVSLAREKCGRATFKVGDILSQPELLEDDYDIITAFRFLLNVEPDLRKRALKRLREVIRPDGWLVVNVHGNSRSLRHPAIVWKRWRTKGIVTNDMLNEMSPTETRDLLGECGFAVEQEHGFGILPPTLYRTPLRPVAAAMDRLFIGGGPLRSCSIDIVFVCRPC